MSIHIETGRLLLRNFSSGDWQDLLEIAIDKAKSEYAIYDHRFPVSEPEIKAITRWFTEGTSYLAVCELVANKLIGIIYLGGEKEAAKELGYTFHSEYWGKGYATEACTAAIDYAFNALEADRITSHTANLNYPSVRLLLALGFHKTGESLASFHKDTAGKPIEFVGASYLLEKMQWREKQRSGGTVS